MKIVQPSVMLEWITPNPAQVIERAGRTCYKSEGRITDDSAEKFIEMVLKRGHESVIEHASASFRVICDRGISHEVVRHRGAGLWPEDSGSKFAFSQESTRYCNYGKSDDGISLIPMMTGLTNEQRLRREDLYRHSESVYLLEIAEGIKPQQARDNLLTCLKTEIVTTANFREWRHFLRLRTAPAAHPQMREVAIMIGRILLEQCPVCFRDLLP